VPPDDTTTKVQPSVAVIVLGYNSRRWLERCLQSVVATEYPRTTIIFVDNGSLDDSCEFVRGRFPTARVVPTGTNLGFAGGNNVGITLALGDGHDYVMLLNADAWMESGCLTEMVCEMEAQPSLGFFTALIRGYDDDLLDRNWLQFARLNMGFLQDLWRGCCKPWYTTESGSGAALLMRSSMLRRIGMLDPEFFMYFEEIDLIRRGRIHGYLAGFSTRAVVHHNNSLESSGPGHSSAMRFERGHMIYVLKDQEHPALKCVAAFVANAVGRTLGALSRRQWSRTWKLCLASAELFTKAPLILVRRHREIYSPAQLPELRSSIAAS
jgi:GT2 family glycosyltransferase